MLTWVCKTSIESDTRHDVPTRSCKHATNRSALWVWSTWCDVPWRALWAWCRLQKRLWNAFWMESILESRMVRFLWGSCSTCPSICQTQPCRHELVDAKAFELACWYFAKTDMTCNMCFCKALDVNPKAHWSKCACCTPGSWARRWRGPYFQLRAWQACCDMWQVKMKLALGVSRWLPSFCVHWWMACWCHNPCYEMHRMALAGCSKTNLRFWVYW